MYGKGKFFFKRIIYLFKRIKDIIGFFGLVTVEYTYTKSYSQLHVDLMVHLSPDQVYTQTFQGRKTYVLDTSKASALGCAVFRYLNTVLSRTLVGRGDSMGVMNIHDLYFLLSMATQEPIHIGHALACQLRHQPQDPRLTTIFLGPYIMRLELGLGMMDCCAGMRRLGDMQLLVVTTLRSMHMIKWRDIPYGV